MLTSSHSVNVSLQGNKHPYDLLKDFAPISQVTRQRYVLVANPRLPKAVQELIALARSNPGKLTYGSSGIGGTSHLAGALFGSLADLEMTHVPYRGGEPAMTDVVAGQIDMLFSTLLQSHSLIQAGKLRALAVTTALRSPALPQGPTMQEGGVPGYEGNPWYRVAAPAGTPAPLANKLRREIARIVRPPRVIHRIAPAGAGTA